MSNKVLKLIFTNSGNKKSILTIPHPKKDLTKEAVQAAMEKIVASKAFGEGDWQLYANVVGAEYYTTQTDAVFTNENNE
ncbi:DUF2922 domain-containing protein [Lactobacillus kimbladii]|uniref:DUF2922 domain-containing protein n=1 Tax=Lactobacillus kimbladii TaxID=1218506 RepID=UPI00061AD2BF|nr:DUF2922 domain-containing protein [Lactobacillus kimbladii]